MELKLEHLAIAMVNNMLLQYFDDERELLHNDCKIVELREEEMTIANSEYQYDVKFDDVKIIARPLSDLAKEIEVNGEKFVPIVELAKIGIGVRDAIFKSIKTESKKGDYSFVDETSKLCFYFTSKDSSFGNFYNGKTYSVFNQYELFQKLLSCHFDLFNLIPNGLAIDVNTLKEPKQTPQ